MIQTIQWVVYRIFNGIKSLFDQTDWQIAEGKIKSHILGLEDLPSLNPVDRFRVESHAEDKARIILGQILDQQNNPHWAVRGFSLDAVRSCLRS